MPIKLIVGLGNPGSQYLNTRHNAGFWFINAVAESCDVQLQPKIKFHGLIAKITINDNDCWLLQPATYMNLSGKAVVTMAKFHNITTEEILVAHDELDFAVGTIKLKSGGGHGGHNGLRSIISSSGSKNFYRLRIGIDHPGDKSAVTDYVLGKPSTTDKQQITDAIIRGVAVVPELVSGNIEQAMHNLHASTAEAA